MIYYTVKPRCGRSSIYFGHPSTCIEMCVYTQVPTLLWKATSLTFSGVVHNICMDACTCAVACLLCATAHVSFPCPTCSNGLHNRSKRYAGCAACGLMKWCFGGDLVLIRDCGQPHISYSKGVVFNMCIDACSCAAACLLHATTHFSLPSPACSTHAQNK